MSAPELNVTVRCATSSLPDLFIHLPLSCNVVELKQRIASQLQNLPVEEQRLVYGGKLLSNNTPLFEIFKVNDCDANHVVHLVTKVNLAPSSPIEQRGSTVRETAPMTSTSESQVQTPLQVTERVQLTSSNEFQQPIQSSSTNIHRSTSRSMQNIYSPVHYTSPPPSPIVVNGVLYVPVLPYQLPTASTVFAIPAATAIRHRNDSAAMDGLAVNANIAQDNGLPNADGRAAPNNNNNNNNNNPRRQNLANFANNVNNGTIIWHVLRLFLFAYVLGRNGDTPHMIFFSLIATLLFLWQVGKFILKIRNWRRDNLQAFQQNEQRRPGIIYERTVRFDITRVVPSFLAKPLAHVLHVLLVFFSFFLTLFPFVRFERRTNDGAQPVVNPDDNLLDNIMQ